MYINVYQINEERDKNLVMFLSHDKLGEYQDGSDAVDPSIYDKVFTGEVDCKSLEDVFALFNTSKPEGYEGRSMSVSDVVGVLQDDGSVKYWFVDSIGFIEIPFDRHPDVKPEEETVHRVTVLKTYKLRSRDIDDIMSDALDNIGYWCGRAEVVGDYLGTYASDQISRGGELILHDAEDDDESWTLDLDKFLKGYKAAIEEGYFSGDLDDDYDGETADSIVQLAIFDEVVYG